MVILRLLEIIKTALSSLTWNYWKRRWRSEKNASRWHLECNHYFLTLILTFSSQDSWPEAHIFRCCCAAMGDVALHLTLRRLSSICGLSVRNIWSRSVTNRLVSRSTQSHFSDCTCKSVKLKRLWLAVTSIGALTMSCGSLNSYNVNVWCGWDCSNSYGLWSRCVLSDWTTMID